MKADSFKRGKMDKCYWKYDNNYDYWETTCNNAFFLENGTPSDNEMIYCCYCGKEIEHE